MGKYEIKRTTESFTDVDLFWWQICKEQDADRKTDSVMQPFEKDGAVCKKIRRVNEEGKDVWAVFVPVAVHEANMTIGGYDE